MCILVLVLTGLGKIVGWAMVGRGELGFVIAKEALDDDILSDRGFIMSVWALLVATFLSPILMKYFLTRQRRADSEQVANLEHDEATAAKRISTTL